MKALSVKQPWASMIASGEKTIETRTWETSYRGRLLIVSSKRPVIDNLPTGMALCTCILANCRLFLPGDEKLACCHPYPWSWVLENIEKITPFHVKGQLGLYDVKIETL